MAQPDLNYIAPEIQTCKTCSYFSDMFSLGILICTIYTGGSAVIDAGYNGQQYLKQLDQVIYLTLRLTCVLIIRVDFLFTKDWSPGNRQRGVFPFHVFLFHYDAYCSYCPSLTAINEMIYWSEIVQNITKLVNYTEKHLNIQTPF